LDIAYVKRFRMELPLWGYLPRPRLPEGYFFVPWNENLIDLHAEVHFLSFCDEIDSAIFPCFNDRNGCRYLLRQIRKKDGFFPAATWLVACAEGCCGTVQGATDQLGHGTIQNLGVMPSFRGLGLGRALLLEALRGYAEGGVTTVALEVTADNEAALRLYQSVGFRRIKTVYKTLDA
jgi:ribosomal protein S18 acetylase RimI-like enzyme